MESSTQDHWARVIAELRLELSRLDQERRRIDGMIEFAQERSTGRATAESPGRATEFDGPYVGLSLVQATVKYLKTIGSSATTREICDALPRGGYETKARKFFNNVYGTLNRESERTSPRIVKAGSKWQLANEAASHRFGE